MDSESYAKAMVDKELTDNGFPDGTDDLRRLISTAIQDALADTHERLLRSQQLNTELARMLAANEWHGGGSDKECPQCGGLRDIDGHAPGCALAAIMKKASTE